MINKIKNNDFNINFVIDNNWNYVSSIREFISQILKIRLGKKIMADKASLAISELLENAIKYSTEDVIKVNIINSNTDLIIEVENKSDDNSINNLINEYDKIMKGTPFEANLNKLKEAAERKDKKSMLGLSRIRFETGGIFNFEVIENIVKAKIILKVEDSDVKR